MHNNDHIRMTRKKANSFSRRTRIMSKETGVTWLCRPEVAAAAAAAGATRWPVKAGLCDVQEGMNETNT
jgi:hypothetical protein